MYPNERLIGISFCQEYLLKSESFYTTYLTSRRKNMFLGIPFKKKDLSSVFATLHNCADYTAFIQIIPLAQLPVLLRHLFLFPSHHFIMHHQVVKAEIMTPDFALHL
uniref:Uncharacterized protein n=1 Tax=Cacopsylla melanoneura TaxID=428564 RepID=A0A8D8ZK07_9HEMI